MKLTDIFRKIGSEDDLCSAMEKKHGIKSISNKSERKLEGKIRAVRNQSLAWDRAAHFFKRHDWGCVEEKVKMIAKRENPPLFREILCCMNEDTLPMPFSRTSQITQTNLPNLRMHEKLRVSSMAKPTYSTNLGDVANELAKIGAKTVISLDLNEWDWREFSIRLGDVGIRHVANSQLAIPDFLPIGGLDPEKLLDICETILANKDPVIHCGAGDGRSGLVKAALYILQEYRGNLEYSIKRMLRGENCAGSFNFKINQEAYDVVAKAVAHVRINHPDAVETIADIDALNRFVNYILEVSSEGNVYK
ncbi:hypothetical protein [Burkholderia ubonensis]|uniref:phosphatase domain-containing putative toxin n=1 Tax=Burkholderia ubonensis TaxID=101571 RepID=UPI0012FA513C|nr:hypothetical protein [Burkholderia ubonensis]